jgi:transcriptional regulator with XRE-family HTH domain
VSGRVTGVPLAERPTCALALRRIARQLGTQEKAAAICGVSPRMFRKYLKGETQPKLAVLERLATAVGLSVDAIATKSLPVSTDERHVALRRAKARFLNTISQYPDCSLAWVQLCAAEHALQEGE